MNENKVATVPATNEEESKSLKTIPLAEYKKPVLWNMPKCSMQALVDKLSRNLALQVLDSFVNFDTKAIHYNCWTGENEVEVVKTFAEAAAEFGWNGFNVSEDFLYAIPVFRGTDEAVARTEEQHTFVDGHFGDAGYCWMSQSPRLFKPINATVNPGDVWLEDGMIVVANHNVRRRSEEEMRWAGIKLAKPEPSEFED